LNPNYDDINDFISGFAKVVGEGSKAFSIGKELRGLGALVSA